MMTRILIRSLAAALVAVAGPAALRAQAASSAAGYKVIVHASNPATALRRAQLSQLFLKKALTWPNGRPVMPVDLGGHAAARQEFSRAVHGRDPGAIRAYWQQQVFAGRAIPPAEKRSEADVIAFVRSTPGAVGYVAAATATPAGVKALDLVQ